MVDGPLDPALVERVLARLGLTAAPPADLTGLAALYRAWCERIPFDNVRKRIHLAHRAEGPLPGDTPDDFFDAWLAHGTGGTCWAGNGALHALVCALGFDARRGLATMVSGPNTPPNHGTVIVGLDGRSFVVDASMLTGAPVELRAGGGVAHPAHGVRCEHSEGRWSIHWRPLHRAEPIPCRIEHVGLSAEEFRRLHETTRAWSPFNYAVSARLNRGDEVIGVGMGSRVVIDGRGASTTWELSPQDRTRLLVDVIGISDSLAAETPPDEPTPPPPGRHA